MDLKTATQKAIHYLRDYPDSKSLSKNISEIIQLYVRNIVAYVVKQEDATTQRLYSKIEDLEHQLNLEKDKTKSIQKIHNEFKDNITDNNSKYIQTALEYAKDLHNTIEGLVAGEDCYPDTLMRYCDEVIENLNKITG